MLRPKQRKRLENEDNVSRSAELSKFIILLCQVNLQLFIFLGLSIVTNFRQQVKFLTKITIN